MSKKETTVASHGRRVAYRKTLTALHKTATRSPKGSIDAEATILTGGLSEASLEGTRSPEEIIEERESQTQTTN